MKAVVIVRGGVVQCVYADSLDINVDVIDADELVEDFSRDKVDAMIDSAIEGLFSVH